MRSPISLGAALALLLAALPAGGSEALDADPCTQVDVVNDSCPSWASTYDGGNNGRPPGYAPNAPDEDLTTMLLSRDGARIYVAGRSYEDGAGPHDLVVLAYTAAKGHLVWSYRSQAGASAAVEIVESPDGGTLYVAGATSRLDRSEDEFLTLALRTTTGAKTWERRWNGGGTGHSRPAGLALSADGNRLYVAGTTSQGPSTATSDYALVAYDLVKDEVLWTLRHDGGLNGMDQLQDLAASPEALFVTGQSKAAGGATDTDAATIAIDPADGTILWSHRRDGGAGDIDSGTRIAAAPDGSRVFVTGITGRPGTGNSAFGPSAFLISDYATTAYDAGTGAPLWTSRYRGPTPPTGGLNIPTAIEVDDRGELVAVTGLSSGALEYDFDAATVAYDAATGAQAWVGRAAEPGHNYELGTALDYDPSADRFYVTGLSATVASTATNSGKQGRMLTVGYDAGTGARVWSARYGVRTDDSERLLDFDEGSAIAVDPRARRVYVGGTLGRRVSESAGEFYEFDLAALSYALPGAGRATPDGGGWASHNLQLVGHVPTNTDTAGAKIVGKYLYLTTSQHLKIYDISDPLLPVPTGVLALPAEEAPYFAEEDPDTNGRVLLFGSRVIDVTNKADPKVVGTHGGDGHTITCVLDCTYGYSSDGPIVDLRNPAQPAVVGSWTSGKPATGSHDVTEVAPGLIVTSSRPIMLLDARGDPTKPVLVARGPTDSAFIHSNLWPRQGTDRFLLTSGETGTSTNCAATKAGMLRVWDATRWKDTGTLAEVDGFAPANGVPVKGGAVANLFCSHWFDPHPDYRDGGLVAWAYYEGGVRLVRISPAGKVSEVGYYIPYGGSTSAAYWVTDEIIYSLDYHRGLDILRYTGRA